MGILDNLLSGRTDSEKKDQLNSLMYDNSYNPAIQKPVPPPNFNMEQEANAAQTLQNAPDIAGTKDLMINPNKPELGPLVPPLDDTATPYPTAPPPDAELNPAGELPPETMPAPLFKGKGSAKEEDTDEDEEPKSCT